MFNEMVEDLTKLASKDSLDRDDYNLANTVLSAERVTENIKDAEQREELEIMFDKVKQLQNRYDLEEKILNEKVYKEMCDAIENRRR